MATFFSNQRIGSWGSYALSCTLTGDVSRSGNTVTLSNIKATLSATNAWGSDTGLTLYVRSGDSVLSQASGVTMNNGSGTMTIGNASVGVATTATSHTFNLRSSDGYVVNFTVSFASGATPPSGPYVNWVSHTWNSVTTTVGVSSWGSGTASTRKLEHIICTSSATASNWDTDSMARRVRFINTQNTSSTAAVTNSYDDWHPTAGPVNIRGCLAYKIATWASTDVGTAGNGGFDNTTRYTPPAPLQAFTAGTQTYAGSNKATIPFTITGGNSTNNNNVTVTTQYRSNINSAGWGAWANVGSGSPWTAKSTSITVACGASVQLQARQVYQSQASEVKSLTVTAIKTPPRLYVPVSGKTKLARKAYISVNGVARKVTKIYKGVNGKSKQVYSG